MISAKGNEALVLLAVHQGLVVPCFSSQILQEYVEVLLRPKFRVPQAAVDALVHLLRRSGIDLGSVPSRQISSDPDDDAFIACVLAAKAQFLVTGNKKHFPANAVGNAQVVNAAELLEYITIEL